ncbi:MAG: AAA family ATPase, partial [Treponema sp.]|nr:AAA family ATPase [Treponema sp.]
MSDQYIYNYDDKIKVLPAWAEELANKYRSKTANLYILHGNIRDFLPHERKEGEFAFKRVQDYISEILFGNREIIAYYDRSKGITFCEQHMEQKYLAEVPKFAVSADVDKGDFLSNDPEKCFPYLEKYFLSQISEDKRVKGRKVLIIDFAEHIVPAGELTRLSDTNTFCVVTFSRWATDPIFSYGDISIILLT